MFERHYFGITEYRVFEKEHLRYIDEKKYKPYLEWIGAGNTAPANDWVSRARELRTAYPHEDADTDARFV